MQYAAVPLGLQRGPLPERDNLLPSTAQELTQSFIRNFRIGTLYVYRDRLLNNAREISSTSQVSGARIPHLEIDLEHLKNFSEELHDAITKHPGEYIEHVSPVHASSVCCVYTLSLL